MKETVADAVADLKKNTPAVVYLDTARYLLIDPDAKALAEALRPYLKPSVKVSVCNASGRVKTAVEYLEIQEDLPTLKNFKKSEKTP